MSLLRPGNEWLVPESSMGVLLRACTEQRLSIDAKRFVSMFDLNKNSIEGMYSVRLAANWKF